MSIYNPYLLVLAVPILGVAIAVDSWSRKQRELKDTERDAKRERVYENVLQMRANQEGRIIASKAELTITSPPTWYKRLWYTVRRIWTC